MPPRILLVMPEHWPRALLRAELIERGYDVVGTPDLATALLVRPVEEDRGPVRVIVIDQDVMVEPQNRLLLQFSEHLIQYTLLGPAIHAHIDTVPIAEPARRSSPLAPVLSHVQDRFQQTKLS